MHLAFKTYSFEQKVAAVEQYLNSSLTKQQVVDQYNISSISSLSKWIIKYQKEGRDSLKPQQKGRPAKTSIEEKRAAEKEEQRALLSENMRLKAELAYMKESQAYVSNILEQNKGRESGFKTAMQNELFQSGELKNWDKAQIINKLVEQGHSLNMLLEIAGIAKSTYHYNKSIEQKSQTRPELWVYVREIFSRTPNGCGHRQIAMTLRKEYGVTVADKTVLKIMHELDLVCAIRKKRARFRYSSYKGVIGSTFDNIIKRDFSARYPWEKMGTDVTEFRHRWGKAYFAPVYDFCSKEIVAWSITRSPNMQQQIEMLEMLKRALPENSRPILQSDMGWQYQHKDYVNRLEEMGIVQSMSRKGNCLDNACTEGLFGHLKDEFYKGQKWESFEDFKEGLEKYIHYWNTQRRQKKLDGLTPAEFRAIKMIELAKEREKKEREVKEREAKAKELAKRAEAFENAGQTEVNNPTELNKLAEIGSSIESSELMLENKSLPEKDNGAGKSAPRRKLRIVKRAA